jgi:hypothetical protein
MAVMPHTGVEQALAAALSLDIPFWPQLPNYSYSEDMYVQASEHFPGICLDIQNRKLSFSKRINVQLRKLEARNANAFMFVDEPGMQFLFAALAGYGDIKAKTDLDQYFAMVDRPLENVWRVLRGKGIDFDLLLPRSLLSPATCCLVNPDREKTVEKVLERTREISRRMREHYGIGE